MQIDTLKLSGLLNAWEIYMYNIWWEIYLIHDHYKWLYDRWVKKWVFKIKWKQTFNRACSEKVCKKI